LKVRLLTVIPVALKVTFPATSSGAKFVPVIVTLRLVCPCTALLGLADVTVGCAFEIVMPPVTVTAPPVGVFVTVRLLAPSAVVPAMFTSTVTCVGLFTVVDVTVMPGSAKLTLVTPL
jgi:hypothetical protein